MVMVYLWYEYEMSSCIAFDSQIVQNGSLPCTKKEIQVQVPLKGKSQGSKDPAQLL